MSKMSRYNIVEMKLDQILVLFLNYYHLKCLSVANLFNQPNKAESKRAPRALWINRNHGAWSGKTEQWHTEPEPAPAATRQCVPIA